MLRYIYKISALFFLLVISTPSIKADEIINDKKDKFILNWSDEFSSFDTNKWYKANSISDIVNIDGKMRLSVKKIGNTYQSARISSITGDYDTYDPTIFYDQKYGRFVASIKVDAPAGICPAFYTIHQEQESGTIVDWNEIDLEFFGNYLNPQYTLHFWKGFDSSTKGSLQINKELTQNSGYHQWVIEWTPNYLTYYMDGALQQRFWRGNGVLKYLFYPQRVDFSTWAFDTAVVDDAGLPAYLYIDYFRYYELEQYEIKAIDYVSASGITTGTDYIGGLDSGDYVYLGNIDKGTYKNVVLEVACNEYFRKIHLRTGSSTGPITATFNIPYTGDWGKYVTVTAENILTGSSHLYMTFEGGSGCGNVRSISFFGQESTFRETECYRIEAEDGTLGNGASIVNNTSFSGGKYTYNMHLTDAYCEITGVSGGNNGGNYKLGIGYAQGDTTSRTLVLKVNGVNKGVRSFVNSGGWNTPSIHYVTIPLNAGNNNTIRLENSSAVDGYVKIDYFAVLDTI
jgi:beta-glucanase (GH16 family)